MTKVTQAHIDARTQDILGAAMSAFARKGVDDTTMQEIAAEAGLSAGAIYRYYPSKVELLRAVFAGCTAQNRAMFAQAAARTESPLQALGDVGNAVWGEFKKPGWREHVILSLESALAAARQPEELGAARHEMLSGLIDMLGGLIERAQAAGEIDPAVDARSVGATLLACQLGTGLLALQLDGDLDTDAVCGGLMEMLQKLTPQAN